MTESQLVDAQKLQPDKTAFSFGRNWQTFVEQHLTPERERLAQQSICDFLETSDLEGRTFLDVGCGSGLFSLAAYRLRARRVHSFDVDPFSVACCQELRRRAGDPEQWTVSEGSILDPDFLQHLPKCEVVYAWGSLHHTGKMWQAIRNAATLVEEAGLFYVSLYNRVEGRRGSAFWLKVKRRYNRSSQLTKRLMEWAFFLRYGALSALASGQRPSTFLRSYGQERGMSFWADVRDWLGGYPYEFASVHEVFRFCTRELGMELINLKATNTTGCNDFLFRRRSFT